MTAPPVSAPRVRVVTVNWQRYPLTAACLRSLLATDWPADRLEVVVVDNASSPGDAAALAAEFPTVRLLAQRANLGFAEGCNVGLRSLGETPYVALVNNDATVDPGWLRPLVATLAADPGLGAACPKLLFAPRFVDVEIHGAVAGARLERVSVGGDDVTGAVQPVSGLVPARGQDRPPGLLTGDAVLRLPVPRSGPMPPSATFTLSGASAASEIRIRAGRHAETNAESGSRGGVTAVTVALGGATAYSYDVINNVGNRVDRFGRGPDRGIGEVDEGQYDAPADVPAFSGGGVLLRREFLDAVGLFDPRLFTYYEDLDLGLRGARLGWRYRTAPASVLFHAWGATTGAGSEHALFHAVRNHLLCTLRNGSPATVSLALGLAGGGLVREALLAGRARGEARSLGRRRVRVRAAGLASAVRLAPATLADRPRSRSARIGRAPWRPPSVRT